MSHKKPKDNIGKALEMLLIQIAEVVISDEFDKYGEDGSFAKIARIEGMLIGCDFLPYDRLDENRKKVDNT